MTTLKKIFDQFIPSSFINIPLSLIGGFLAFIWIFLLVKSHWALNRANLMGEIFEVLFSKILPSPKKIQKIWYQWLFATFILILRFKVCSLIPYTFALTSHLRVTFSLSLPIWIRIQIVGIFSKWKNKLSHLVPMGTPLFLIPIMVLIESIRLIIQPITLGFRLGANLLAGHLLIFLCSCVVWEAIKAGLLGYLSFFLLFALFVLEIAVAFIQATVFLMLSKQYLEENTH